MIGIHPSEQLKDAAQRCRKRLGDAVPSPGGGGGALGGKAALFHQRRLSHCAYSWFRRKIKGCALYRKSERREGRKKGTGQMKGETKKNQKAAKNPRASYN
jgi:hypothetical protein